MKIAVVHNLPAGGQMRALFEQVKRLSRNHHLEIFTLSTSDDTFLPLKSFARATHVINFQYSGHFPRSIYSVYFSLKNAYREMARYINGGGFDVAYINPCFLTQAPYIMRYLTIPSVYSCPEPKREFYEQIPRTGAKFKYYLILPFRRFIKKIDYINTRKAGTVVTLSEFNKNRIDRIYHINSSINYLGADGKTFRPVKVVKENYVLSVGNFTLLKGHDFIIESLAKVENKIRPDFVLAGLGGEDRQYLENLSHKLHVKLKIIAKPSDVELNNLYNRAKLFVFAALNEPFGLVILEALATGLKVIAVNDGGIPEIITGKKLGQLSERNQEQFARLLESNIRNTVKAEDCAYRRKYVSDNWNWEDSVGILADILQATASIRTKKYK